MSDDAPRPAERAASEEPAPASAPAQPATSKPSRRAGVAVLLVATAAAVLLASLSTSGSAPRGGGADSSSRRWFSLPSVGGPPTDLAQPNLAPRRRDPSPFDGPTTDSAVTACVAEVRAALPAADSIEVQELFGDVDPSQGRPDSLIVEGRAGESVWHCGSSKRQDGAVYQRSTTIERIWTGTPTAFPAVHAVTVAAEESCMRQVSKAFHGYGFRGIRREQRGDVLYISGDAFPLNYNDLVGEFSCSATIHAGRIVDAKARKSK